MRTNLSIAGTQRQEGVFWRPIVRKSLKRAKLLIKIHSVVQDSFSCGIENAEVKSDLLNTLCTGEMEKVNILVILRKG